MLTKGTFILYKQRLIRLGLLFQVESESLWNYKFESGFEPGTSLFAASVRTARQTDGCLHVLK